MASTRTRRLDPRIFYFLAGCSTIVIVLCLLQIWQKPHVLKQAISGHPGEDGWYKDSNVDVLAGFLTEEEHNASNENMQIEHAEIHSQMTKDGKWFIVDFLNEPAYNPSIIPHPYKPDTFFMFAVRDKSKDNEDVWNSELFCEATYHKDKTMRCTAPPLIVPIASTVTDQCKDELVYMNDMIGPHDPRVFFGPDRPYIIYGSQSGRSCLGQWMHDLRRLIPWNNRTTGQLTDPQQAFFNPTDLKRPPPYGAIEKNWFAFWDSNDEPYLHYDIKGDHRVFAKLQPDGFVGKDLAPLAKTDKKCMEKLMPTLHQNDMEWVHQATNSLSITLCNRTGPECKPTDDNTFNAVIFQVKTFYYHGVYEPYLMLFKRQAPFQVHGISRKPFWYNGRGKAGEPWRWSSWKPNDQTQMVFTTQMAWRQQGLMYHGYLDDDIIISFGIEDKHGGGIDVRASDLMQGMEFCHDLE